MSRKKVWQWLSAGSLSFVLAAVALFPSAGWAQEEIARKVKSRVQPNYPDLAKRMSISGSVKLQVVVAPNGSVKSTKIVGGHPLLANAASDALKKWRFEPGPEETTGLIEFKFAPMEQ